MTRLARSSAVLSTMALVLGATTACSSNTPAPIPRTTQPTDLPDQLRVDLDPQPGTGFTEAVPAALALRELMTEVGLTGFVKTSGNRGIHVFAPIEPEHEFLDVRHAVIALARELERRMPDELSTAWWKE